MGAAPTIPLIPAKGSGQSLGQPLGRGLCAQLGLCALARGLVGAPADELGPVAETIAGDVVVAHLDDELGLERRPLAAAFGGPAAGAARGVAGEALATG